MTATTKWVDKTQQKLVCIAIKLGRDTTYKIKALNIKYRRVLSCLDPEVMILTK